MKKLLYVCKYALHHKQSLKVKFDGQLQGFEKLGFDVYYLAFDEHKYYLMHGQEKQALRSINAASERYLHTFALIDLYKCAIQALQTLHIDILYVRNDPLEFSGLKMYRLAKKQGCKIICEVPTYPLYKSVVMNPLFQMALKISDYFSNAAGKYIDYYAVIGETTNTFNGRPAINISNGIDVEKYSLRCPASDDTIHMIGVASMSIWQGFDRAIAGLANYHGTEKIHLHFVGDEGDGSLSNWKSMVSQYQLEDSVSFYPAMYGKELDSLMNMVDVGFSPLAWHRNGLKAGSALKVREYMSRGLPFIYTVQDACLTEQLPYLLQMPNDDTPLNMEKLVAFAKQYKNNQEIPTQMRNYAKTHITWEKQLQKLF